MVRFGIPEFMRRGTMLTGGAGAGIVCIESREVLENDGGAGAELRLFLLPHRKNEIHDRWVLVVMPGAVGGFSDCSGWVSGSWGGFERDNFRRNGPFGAGLVGAGGT
jgi:hypothetical protein